jgi:hypothetical protein
VALLVRIAEQGDRLLQRARDICARIPPRELIDLVLYIRVRLVGARKCPHLLRGLSEFRQSDAIVAGIEFQLCDESFDKSYLLIETFLV